MNHQNVVLASEVGALIVLLALGGWRMLWLRQHSDERAPLSDISGRPYDMRRDGQRLHPE